MLKTPHVDIDAVLSKLSLFTLALMVSVPFLITRHFQPLPSFSSEWWAAVLGLAAFGLTFFRRKEALIFPQIAMLPLVFFPLILIQWISGVLFIPSAAIITVEYLAWAICMTCLGAQLNATVGLPKLVQALSWGLLIGGIASSLATLTQYFQVAMSPYIVFPSINGRIYGNVGQPNHLAAQLWIAIGSAIYLTKSGRLPTVLFILSTTVLMAGAAVSQSRSVALYMILVALLTGTERRFFKLALLLPLLQISLLLVAPYLAPTATPNATPPSVQSPTLQRMSKPSTDVRWDLWRDAWGMFTDHPWIGVGTGNYARASVEYSAAKTVGLPLPAEHAHNFFMQILAMYGLPLTLIVVALGIAFLRRFIPRLVRCNQPELYFSAMILAIIGVHSQLEYPLWYTYFLGIAALTAGSIDSQYAVVALEKRKTMIAGIILVGTAFLAPLKSDELKIERALLWHFNAQSPAQAFAGAIKTIEEISTDSLLSPYGEMVLTTTTTPTLPVAKHHWKLCESVLKFSPTIDVLKKCSISARMLGLDDEANALDDLKERAWSGKVRHQSPSAEK